MQAQIRGHPAVGVPSDGDQGGLQEICLLVLIIVEPIMPTLLMPPERPPAESLIRGPVKSKTIFPVLILHLLDKEPDHGSGLMARIDELCRGLLAVNTNTIYPLLRRLEERGFIAGSWEHPTKRSKRFYRITPEGRERLARIKEGMLPYLDLIAASVRRLRRELYGEVPPSDGPSPITPPLRREEKNR